MLKSFLTSLSHKSRARIGRQRAGPKGAEVCAGERHLVRTTPHAQPSRRALCQNSPLRHSLRFDWSVRHCRGWSMPRRSDSNQASGDRSLRQYPSGRSAVSDHWNSQEYMALHHPRCTGIEPWPGVDGSGPWKGKDVSRDHDSRKWRGGSSPLMHGELHASASLSIHLRPYWP